ncbi:T9SS type A sorting domain-containing protein [Hymenobacter latericus]|uniref:T9SS type A sorting domain-containing protein n=1 Tax=Hymenobacter sp. YIM 151858-1 TaxID=2987688 RepID=UPI002225E253|nr:T9SS type A sorting domain-containing protein [Hymenobacter sp. YIM 151858-1]UYZ59617.1 T9SS type A sorting domain-containing protein [Hymenobacter sp. YIM 151858-1]
MSNTTVYARFRPTQVGTIDPDLNFLYAQSNTRPSPPPAFAYSDFIRLTGVGTAAQPEIQVSPTALGFGSQTINTTSTPQAITVTGLSLTNPITVTAPAGFQVSNGGAYGTTTTLPASGGTVNVVFAPTVVQNYVDEVTFSSAGAPSKTVSVSGAGEAPAAVLNVSPTSLNFGTIDQGSSSPVQSIQVSGSFLSNDGTGTLSVGAPNGFLIRTGTNNFGPGPIALPIVNGSVAQTTIDVIFAPNTAGSFSGNISFVAPRITRNVSVQGQANAVTTPTITVNPDNLNFQTVSNSGSGQTLSFTVRAINLTEPLVLTGSSSNIVFRDATASGGFVNGTLSINPEADGSLVRVIEVRLAGPFATGTTSFSGNITASSAGAINRVVTVTASPVLAGNSVINVSGDLVQFSTVPGEPSAVQTYTVEGSNLLQPLTVQAPPFFQISKSSDFDFLNGATGNSLQFVADRGNDLIAKTIYIRYLPPNARDDAESILHSSDPAQGVAKPVTGTSQPTIFLANAFNEVRQVVINTTSAAQQLNLRAERVRRPITISTTVEPNTFNPSNTQQFEFSLTGVEGSYQSSVTINPNATTFSVNQQIYVRYKPTYLGSALGQLRYQSSDFAISGLQFFQNNGLLTGRSIDTQPTKEATVQDGTLRVTRSGSTATVEFLLPPNYVAEGYGEGRLIVASESAALPPANQPVDGTSYQTGNQRYGEGPQLAPGYFSVYAGSNLQAVIENLDPTKDYYFYIFEFNNVFRLGNTDFAVQTAENYKTPTVPDPIIGIRVPGTPQPPLPVELVSFDAKLRNGKVYLNWATAQEKNNRGFEVERSQNGSEFASIGFRAGHGTSAQRHEYSLVDEQPLGGVSYYRLKQLDNDGKVNYSPVLTVKNGRVADVAVYPNPVDDVLNVRLSQGGADADVVVSDLLGRIVLRGKLSANGTFNTSSLQPGNYVVTITSGAEKVTRKVTKR